MIASPKIRTAATVAALTLIAACSGSSGDGTTVATTTELTAGLDDMLDITLDGTPAAGTPFTIEVANVGAMPHSLALDGRPEVATPTLNGGETATLAVPALDAGTYTFFCAVPGHREGGMETTLAVVESTGEPRSMEPGAAPATLSRKEMDAMHLAGVKAFPAETTGVGGQVLEPKLVGGVKVFHLTAQEIQWEVSPDEVITAFAYNQQVPGPEIRVRKGDRIRVVLRNELPESTSIHFHGVRVPNAMDGVPFINQDPVLPGESFTYQFKVTDDPGTHMYHSHHNSTAQVGKGLLGAFIVEDPTPAWDAETTMVLGDGPLGYTINGKGFPATAPIVAKLGSRQLIRFMNEGQQIHPMHLHGFHFQVVALDGFTLAQPYMLDTIMVAPGARVDVIARPDLAGIWAFHCHILSHAESEHGMFGMVTAMIVK